MSPKTRAFGSAVVAAFLVLSADAYAQSRLLPVAPGARNAARPERLLAAMTPQSPANVYGRAIDVTKAGVPGAHMRLRNARTGRIAGQGITDRHGDFEFLGVEPGMYVPEMVSQSNRLIAAGEMLVLEYGQTVSTIVRLPVKLSLYNLMRESGALTDALETSAVSALAPGAVNTGIFAPTLGTIINVATSAGILTRIPQGPNSTPGQ